MKTKKIEIRCSYTTKERWKRFVKRTRDLFETAEDVLNFLLSLGEEKIPPRTLK